MRKFTLSADWLRRQLEKNPEPDFGVWAAGALADAGLLEDMGMSWSFSGVGRPTALAVKLEEQFRSYHCIQPEEGIRQKIAVAIGAALAAFPDNSVVQVEASGHQGQTDSNGRADNTFSVKVTPLYGFVG